MLDYQHLFLFKNGGQSSPLIVHGRELVRLPVAFASSSVYSFSFIVDHNQAKSGTYQLEFVREVDLRRAQVAKDYEVKPLFTVSISHKEVTESGLWVRMEVLVLVGLLALLVVVANKKKLFHQKNSMK